MNKGERYEDNRRLKRPVKVRRVVAPAEAPAGRESLFNRTADYVSAAMGRPANIVVWLVLVVGWTSLFALHIVSASADFLPAWFTGTAFNFLTAQVNWPWALAHQGSGQGSQLVRPGAGRATVDASNHQPEGCEMAVTRRETGSCERWSSDAS
jgi:hypothetical protein